MGLFIREKSDGGRSPGYLVYLLAALASVAGLWMVYRRGSAGADAPPPRRARTRASDVSPITEPAATLSAVEVASRPPASEAPSYRMGRRPVPPEHPGRGAGSPGDSADFDAIDQALASPPGGERDGADSPGFAELPPALPPPQGGEGSLTAPAPIAGTPATGRRPRSTESAAPPPQLFGYRDATADATNAAPGPAAAPPELSPDFFAPRGTLVAVYLLTTVDTGNPAALVQFAAARPLFFNHRCQIPFGTRFLGRLSGNPVRDRLNLSADTILYPDGLELPVSASAVEADASGSNLWPGVAAIYIPSPLWVRATPYFSEFFTGAMGLLASRAQQQVAIGAGGVGIQEAPVGGGLRAPLYQASGQAVEDLTQASLKEVERRFASHYLIPAGTACWLQLDEDLDLAPAHASRRVIRLQAGPRLPLSPDAPRER